MRCNATHLEVAQHYRAADFLIHPSRAESGMCFTVLEAMASNLPMILCRNILHNLPNDVDATTLGIVIDDYHVDNYIAAVRRFIAAPMSVNSRTIVERHFSLELFKQQYRELVSDLIREKG